MKERPKGFLSEENIDHDSEIFDYIMELHDYLWKFIHIFNPDAGGSINDNIDDVIKALKNINIAQVEELINDALWTDGAHHKQWYLYEIAEKLGFKKEDFCIKDCPEEGIAP